MQYRSSPLLCDLLKLREPICDGERLADFERKSAIARLTARVPTLTNFADPTIWTRANLDILCSLNSALADLYGLGLAKCSYSVREDSSRLVPNTETEVGVLFAKALRPAGS